MEVPDLRIISDELWERVQVVNRHGRDKYYATRKGALNRTEHNRKYLFSGVLYCGVCGGPYTAITARRPMCGMAAQTIVFAICAQNKVTILRTRLERQLIAALSANLMDNRLVNESNL